MAENDLEALLRKVGEVKAEDILDGDHRYLYNIKLSDTNGQSNTTGDDINAIPESTSGDTEGRKGHTATKDLLIHEEIARGGFGIVYKMTISDGKTERKACLKQSRDSSYDELIQESEIFNKFSEPLNEYIITRILACKRITNGQNYLGLEYFDGETLARMIADYIKENQQISHIDLVLVFQQQIEAIDYLQSYPIYHCDITPNNIMYNIKSQKSKLIDFGLALCPDKLGDELKRHEGTMAYKAPEMLLDSTVGDRTDVYGLAATLHHLITLKSPWSSLVRKSPNEVYQPPTKEHIKAEIYRYTYKSDEPTSELAVQTELREGAWFCDMSIVCLLQKMLSYKPTDRPKCGEILVRIPDKDAAPSISADSRAETSSEDVDGLVSESYYAVTHQPESSIADSEGVSGTATDNYTASTSSQLSFRAGQRILNIVPLIGVAGFSKGQIGNQSGTFPTCCVNLDR